jgi:hypothetical protein
VTFSVVWPQVKTYAVNNSSGHTFYVMGADGSAPDRGLVETACNNVGGRLVEAGEEARSASEGNHKFSFSFLNRRWHSNWEGNNSSPVSSLGST